MEKLQRNLIGDPRYGVLGGVNHINGQIEQALHPRPAEVELRPYLEPSSEERPTAASFFDDSAYDSPSDEDPW